MIGRNFSTRWLHIPALVATLALASSAHAQEGFRVSRYAAPPSPEDGLVLQLPSTLGHLRWAPSFVLDYAYDPLELVLRDEGGRNRERVDVVGNQLLAHLNFALGLGDRYELFASLPVIIFQEGDGDPRFSAPSTAALGEPRIGGSVALLQTEDGVSLGAAASLRIPAGSQDAFGDDGNVSVEAAGLAAWKQPWGTLAANLGLRYRPQRDFFSGESGSEVFYMAGAYVPVHDRVVLSGELSAATAFRSGETPFEATAGASYRFAGGFRLRGGIGPGFTRAPGTPALRVLVSLGWAKPRPAPKPAPAPPPPADRDGDGILDKDDKCPDEPETLNGVEDSDGCPESDRDLDTILDADDACPDDPEVFNGIDDEDGCPDGDQDGDGIPDQDDQCPTEPEDFDGVADEDGCPDKLIVKKGAVTTLDRIQFDFDTADLRPESYPILREVARVMAEQTDIRLLKIEGHTSDEGTSQHNWELSEERARAVADWLVAHGVDPQRLSSRGYGESRPIRQGEDESSRSINRRVEFVIVREDAE